MSLTDPTGAARGTGFRHESFAWTDREGFLARAVPFVADAVGAGEPVLVALAAEHSGPLRDALGPDAAAAVQWVDLAAVGRNPARLLPVLLSFLADGVADGIPRRALGQPLWPGRDPEEAVECALHEALVDVAVAPVTRFWLLCPYDGARLPQDALDDAARGHAADGPARSTGAGRVVDRLLSVPLPEPAHVDAEVTVQPGALSAVRRLTTQHATGADLPASRVTDLVLAVNELAANSLDHGGGSGTVRIWHRPDAVVVEVRDAGRFTDPLAGRIAPVPDQPRGRGLWMVHQLCDLVQIRPTPEGTAVRVLVRR